MTSFSFTDSGFKNSPFGQFWEEEPRENAVLEAPQAVATTGINTTYVIRDEEAKLKSYYEKYKPIESSIRVLLHYDKEHWDDIKFIGGKVDAATDTGLRYDHIVKVFGIQASPQAKKASEKEGFEQSYVGDIANSIGIPSSDPKNLRPQIEKLLSEALKKADLSISSNNVIAQILFQLKKELTKFVAPVLEYTADKIDGLKITDENYWSPYNADGSVNPGYSPLLGADPKMFAAQIDALMQVLEGKVSDASQEGGVKIEAQIPKDVNLIVDAAKGIMRFLFDSLFSGIKPLLEVFKSMVEAYGVYYDLHNAFLVGLYNGIIGFVSDTLRTIAFAIRAAADNEFYKQIVGQIGTAIDKFLKKGVFNSIVGFFESIFNRYAKSKDIYTAAKNLGEDTIAIIEIVLMVISGIGLAMVIANMVKETLKFAYTFMTKLAKSLKKNVDDFLRSFDIDKAVKEAVEEFGKKADDAVDNRFDELIKRHGKAVQKGDPKFKKVYDDELKEIVEATNNNAFKDNSRVRYKKKKRSPSLTEEAYLKMHQTRIQNILKGAKAEEIFLNLFKGFKPKKAIKTNFTNRFVDNIVDGVGREIKSGTVKNTQAFQKQFMKDVDIIKRELSGIKTYEWHVLGGVEDNALEWAIKYAADKGMADKIKFILY